VFREVAEDENATTQAAIIVFVVTFLSAIGSGIGLLIAREGFGRAVLGFLGDWLVSGILVGWIGWAILTYLVGTLLFKGRTDLMEMLRVLGYASAPRLLGLLSWIPCVGWLFALAGWILSLIAGVIGIREAMEFDTGSAIVTVVISWIISLLIALAFRALFGLGFVFT
jgi:hypothetical protein